MFILSKLSKKLLRLSEEISGTKVQRTLRNEKKKTISVSFLLPFFFFFGVELYMTSVFWHQNSVNKWLLQLSKCFSCAQAFNLL